MDKSDSFDSYPVPPNIDINLNHNKPYLDDKNNIVYDMEINVNSILGFRNGWEISYPNEKGEENYLYACKNPTIVYSIIGNKNRGKSFILSKIANKNLPYGFNITTKGLSLAFPTYTNDIALLDSVGFESPLLESDGDEYRIKLKDKKETDKIYENIKQIKKKLEELRRTKMNIRDIREKENELYRARDELREKAYDIDDQIYNLTNERKITDYFLQRFIIENANIILLVVGKLSIDDQFFLNKLTKLIKESRKQFLQKIIVVHNLMTMKDIATVEKYIEETLNKSLTFILQKREDLYMEGEKRPYNRYCYYEVNKSEEEDINNDDEKDIVHVIMAKEGTKAGEYYNNSAIDYIRKIGNNNLNSNEFDIISKLKNFFCDVSETIFKFSDPNERIEPKYIELKKENGKDKLILNYKKELELDTFYGDFFYDTFGDPKFEPSYYIVTTDKDYLKIYLECPGEISINHVDVNYGKSRIIIKGKREKHPCKAMGRKFSSGEFETRIKLKKSYMKIDKKPIFEGDNEKHGFYIIKFKKKD